jgi:sodium/hydrogen antiporter
MAWDQLDVNKPHLVYIILGGYTTLFMLCSSIIKEKLYIGEATVATVVGIIFGPIAANLINPLSWGNTDQITLEFSRIVLVVQCFAVGVELPKRYMNRHWRSVTLLLVPIMGTGWIVVTLVLWWLFHDIMDFKACLCVAACVTATDPVLASSVVGKGKFAKRVPKHLRDVLSAESGCNDGMAFPFIYLALYVIRYSGHPGTIVYHWVVNTILYECVFGVVFGVTVGYVARRLIRTAHERDYIDRESFLVFYFVLALFCAGAGSILGIDDLLVGFAAGVGFSNDGWFLEKTEESHVSNVIDLLLNLSFFVYLGTIIPWSDFNSPEIGLPIWKLIVLAIFVLLFRRIPIMMLLKPLIPDVKTWREALFAGHFGPIGVGAVFVAVLARAELENGGTTPEKAEDIDPNNPEYKIIQVIWPITVWLVMMSIVVHGSSIAVFTLGKRINTLQLTFSYTTHLEDGARWMDRLPRIQSRKSSMSRPMSEADADEKIPGGDLGGPISEPVSPISAIPRDFLRRHRERSDSADGNRSRDTSRTRSKKHRKSRSKKYNDAGGPVSQSAITPASQLRGRRDTDDADIEVYREGDDFVVEDQDGNVLDVRHSPDATDKEGMMGVEKDLATGQVHDEDHISEIDEKPRRRKKKRRSAPEPEPEPEQEQEQEQEQEFNPDAFDPPQRPGLATAGPSSWWRRPSLYRQENPEPEPEQPVRRHGPARAYTFGNTVIVEDEDGEVIKQYSIPAGPAAQAAANAPRERLLSRIWPGRGSVSGPSRPQPEPVQSTDDEPQRAYSKTGELLATAAAATGLDRNELEKRITNVLREPNDEDDRIRFTIEGENRRLKKDEFINELMRIETNRGARGSIAAGAGLGGPAAAARPDLGERSKSKQQARRLSPLSRGRERRESDSSATHMDSTTPEYEGGDLGRMQTLDPSETRDYDALTPAQSHLSTTGPVPGLHRPVADTLLSHFAFARGGKETAAQRRRRDFVGGGDDGQSLSLQQTSSHTSRSGSPIQSRVPPNARTQAYHHDDEPETAAERRRRVEALGIGRSRSRDEEDEDDESITETDTSESEDDGTGLGFRRLPPQGPAAGGRATRSRAAPSTTQQRPASAAQAHAPDSVPRSAGGSAGSAPTPTNVPSRRAAGLRLRWGEDVGRRPQPE